MIANSSRNINNDHSNMDRVTDIPSSIIWTQTMESITLQIDINHVTVSLTEKYLKLSNRSNTITLPLFHRVYIDQCDIDQMTLPNNSILLTLEKECFDLWPHLLMQQTDKEIEIQLLESNFLIQINYKQDTVAIYDTLDFDSIINGQGEKTGLE